MFISVCIYADNIPNVPLGPLEFISLDFKPNSMTTARITGGDTDDLIITYERPGITIYSGDSRAFIDTEYAVSLIEPIRKRNDTDLIACVPFNRAEIQVLRFDAVKNEFGRVWSKELQSSPYMLKSADVSNNGFNDILLLLQGQPGVGVIRNNGGGRFGELEFLFDDILVSMFQVVDLNGDGINDFILFDPIQNVLRFHFGFGRMSYSLERYHTLPASINYFHALPIAEEGIYDFVAAFPDNREFRVFLGDGLGRYSHIQTRSISSQRYSFLFTDLFYNRRPDLVVAERGTGKLRLYKNKGKDGYEPAGTVQLTGGIRDIAVWKNPETGMNELYCIDIDENRLIKLKLLPAVQDYLPENLALASEPSDMVVANLFGGELPELYVLSKEAATISVYWYNRAFELNHSMISLPGNPDRLYVHPGPEDRIKLVASEIESDHITIVSMEWDTFDAHVYGIPAMTGSEVIYLGLTQDDQFRFGTISFPEQTESPILSLFDQIAKDEYIERTITPVNEGSMLALDVIDLTGNNAVDIVYMFPGENGEGVYMTSALNDSAYVFRRQEESLVLDGSTVTRGYIFSEKRTTDLHTSFIVYLDDDEKRDGGLFRITGDRNGLLSLLTANSGGKRIRSRNHVYLMPSYHSTFNDVIYYNALTEQIEIIYSNPHGEFTGHKPLKRANDLTAFTVYSEPFGEIHMLVVGRKGKSYIEVSRIEE